MDPNDCVDDVRRLTDLVRKLARRAVGPRHYEDVAQDAMLKMVPRFRTFTPAVWFQIAPLAVRWAAASYFRSEYRQPKTCSSLELDLDTLAFRLRLTSLPTCDLRALLCLASNLQLLHGAFSVRTIAKATGLPRRRISRIFALHHGTACKYY